MGGDGGLGLLHALHVAVVGSPAHALGLGDEVADALSRAEPLASLEGAAERPVPWALPLGAVAETMGLARGKGESTWRQLELGDAITRLGADEPPAPAAEGLGHAHPFHPVVMPRRLAGPGGGGVEKARPSALLGHVDLIADGGGLPA